MLTVGRLLTKVETIAWATPREGLSLWDLADTLVALGNIVLEMDETNNRIKVLHRVDTLEENAHGN